MSSNELIFNDENIAKQRLESFFDDATFNEIGKNMEDNQHRSALVCGFGTVNGKKVCAFSQGGSVCKSNITKMKKLYDFAFKTKSPLVGFYDSYGLDLSEGIELLNDFGELLLAQNNLSGLIPQVSVIVGSCISVNAMLACSADYVLMSKSSSFFTAPTDSKADDSMGTSFMAAKSGIAHIVAPDELIISETQKLISFLCKEKDNEFEAPTNDNEFLREQSKNIINQDPLVIIENVFDKSSISLFFNEFGSNVVGAAATLGGNPVGIIATSGATITADDAVKIAKLVYVWDSLSIPVVTFVNTDGMALSSAAAARDFSKITHVYAESTVPKIAVITGKAYGAGYVALASRSTNSDYTVAWPAAIISPLPPHTSVAFLQGDMIKDYRGRQELETNYIKGEASALSAAKKGVIDDIIDPEETRSFLIKALNGLINKEVINSVKKHGNIPF